MHSYNTVDGKSLQIGTDFLWSSFDKRTGITTYSYQHCPIFHVQTLPPEVSKQMSPNKGDVWVVLRSFENVEQGAMLDITQVQPFEGESLKDGYVVDSFHGGIYVSFTSSLVEEGYVTLLKPAVLGPNN